MDNKIIKSKFLKFFFKLGSALIIGLSVGAIVMAFNNPSGNPTTGGGIIGVGSGAPASSLYIDSAGKVGIGMTNPGTKLQVSGSGLFTSTLNLGSVGATGGTTGTLAFGGVGGSVDGFAITNNAGGNYLKFYGVSNPNTSFFVIRNTGKVGIGTDNPTGALHVIDPETSWAGQIENTNSGGSGLLVKTVGPGEQSFAVQTGGDYKFYIKGNGNVGIGMSNPTVKLVVHQGDIYINDLNYGIIMRSPDGTCWKYQAANGGTWRSTAISCP
ncbi:MAG: hypothetical protein WC475_00835 [Candidatus Paceibacterota bacterium]